MNAPTVSANIIDDLIYMFRAKQPLYLRHFRLDEIAETDVSDQQGMRKMEELHTSAKRAETWRGGVKWWQLTIGLVVASGGETETGKEHYRWGGYCRRRAPAWLQNDTNLSGRKYTGHLDVHKMFEYTMYLQDGYSGSEHTAVRACSNSQKERNSTKSQRQRQTS